MGLGSEIRIRKETYSGSRIRIQGSKRHRIRDPDQQNWIISGSLLHILHHITYFHRSVYIFKHKRYDRSVLKYLWFIAGTGAGAPGDPPPTALSGDRPPTAPYPEVGIAADDRPPTALCPEVGVIGGDVDLCPGPDPDPRGRQSRDRRGRALAIPIQILVNMKLKRSQTYIIYGQNLYLKKGQKMSDILNRKKRKCTYKVNYCKKSCIFIVHLCDFLALYSWKLHFFVRFKSKVCKILRCFVLVMQSHLFCCSVQHTCALNPPEQFRFFYIYD